MKINPDLFIKGYYIISVPTDKSVRLLNFCQKKNISLSQFDKSENSMQLVISTKDYNTLSEFTEKAQIQCEIIANKGLPGLLLKRPVQIISFLLILFVVFLVVINRFIWNINVTGSTYYTDEQIQTWVLENAVPIGTKKKEISCSKLEYQIKEGLNAIKWISCSIDGTTLVIDVSDNGDLDITSDDDTASDVISDVDCIITDIIPVTGTALVSVGDEVKKGDILISGEVIIYNDYGEEVDTAHVDAMGYITGMITEVFNETVLYERQEKIYEKSYKSFGIGFKDAYVSIFSPKFTTSYDMETELKNLSIGESFYLPFSVATYNIRPYLVTQLTNTEQKLRDIMSKRVTSYVSDLQKKGVEIVENNVKMYLSDKGCTAKGTILYKKNIGYKGD
jgi:similar to stage IV sporulation protein